ncbi:MAG TPA: flagellar assembly protein FliW [Syntrophomonadaceae bacterium]|nr:flagellar assembly protein FliW [Syntrophomonadaceae bacterium]
MEVYTARFGTLEVAPEKVLRFPRGMVGFPELKEFFFVPLPDNDVFVWMQAVNNPDVAFLMVDPFVFFPDYEVDLSEAVCEFLGIKDPSDATLLTVVTIPSRNVQEMTTNLLAPVVINHVKGVGQQVILESSGYRTKHLLFHRVPPHEARRACG